MNLLRSLEAIAGATGDGVVDWGAVGEASRATVSPGSIDLTEAERTAYAADVRAARDRVRSVSGLSFDVPPTLEVLNRHHWIDANVPTFREIMAPLEDRRVFAPGIARRLNTATMATLLSFLANHVLGQYDPLLLADDDAHRLYFVHPNVLKTARDLDVPPDRFRRWIVFHEVAHAAEFGAAPWLTDHLESRIERATAGLAAGEFDRAAVNELDAAMTAVEGYAEFVMDRAFDDEYADLRAKVEARRRSRGSLADLLSRLFGLGLKRRQYERGRAFFDAVVDARGAEGASAVWESPDRLPTPDELDAPDRWLARVGE